METEPENLLYIHDHEGDGVWMDFLYAPKQKQVGIRVLEHIRGIEWVAWEHRQSKKPHIKLLKDLKQCPAFKD